MSTENIYKKLNEARIELQGREFNKSGKNAFAGFNYYELGDFLPSIKEINKSLGIFTKFDLIETGDEKYATLEIINADNTEEKLVFRSPVATLDNKKMQPIQVLGSIHTYLKRYLYLNAYEIVEGDVVDSLDQVKTVTETKYLNDMQSIMIKNIKNLIKLGGIDPTKVQEKYNIDKLHDLTLQRLHEVGQGLLVDVNNMFNVEVKEESEDNE